MAEAINLSTDTTGVVANADHLGPADPSLSLRFMAAEFGSSQFVEVTSLEGPFVVLDARGQPAQRGVGSDVLVRVNNIDAQGDGLDAVVDRRNFSVHLRLSERVESGEVLTFRVVGGGVQVPGISSSSNSQPLRISFPDVRSSSLACANGRLYQLAKGQEKSLNNDVHGGLRVVDEAFASLRHHRNHLRRFGRTLDSSAVFMPDVTGDGFLLTKVHFRKGVRRISFVRAESVQISPDGTLVFVTGLADGAAAVLRRDTETGMLTFDERLRRPEIENRHDRSTRYVPVLSEATSGLTKIQSLVNRAATIVDTFVSSYDSQNPTSPNP